MREWGLIKPTLSNRPTASIFNTKSAKYIYTILSTVMSEVEEEEYVQKLRVSSLPICGLLDAIGRITRPPQPIPYSMSFYTSVGTAVHENLQERMIRSKKYGRMCFGNWECRECKAVPLQHCLRPKSLICPECKRGQLGYKELDFMFHGISGHLDMLTLDKRGNYVAWEFKTTTESNIQSPTKYLPQLKHKMQIETYCMMLRRLHNIRVHSYAIVYISRNKTQMSRDMAEQFVPFVYKFTKQMRQRRERQIEQIEQQDLAIKRLLSKPTRKNIERLEALRPCRSKKDYGDEHTGMKHAFHSGDCPYAKRELCFRNKDSGTEPGMLLGKLLKVPSKIPSLPGR